MSYLSLLNMEAVVPTLRADSKKQAIEEISAHASRCTGLGQRDIFDTLLAREQLGSTGVGRGIAIPHGKIDGLDRLAGVFARLERPINFDAPDGQPVDLIFLLLAPASAGAEHLKALARIARVLRDPDVVDRLRKITDRSRIYALLSEDPTSSAA